MESMILTYIGIVNRCKKLSYCEMAKIGYYKLRGNWEYQSLVFNAAKVKRMWLEDAEFRVLKLLIECISNNAEGENTYLLFCNKHYMGGCKSTKDKKSNDMPYVEHYDCSGHISANWKKMHKREEFKKLF